ncbi:MAG TPA: hypothetical protein PLH92_17190 [Mycobacterium sp.]|nr:hypothetical protein [Mycobacterium sp.]HQC78443.1 hypothetical protein [Mycobacterium sp.]
MTTTDNAADWHDLTDQLTIDQICDLTRSESVEGITAAGLLGMARQHVENNLGAMLCADLPTPAAEQILPWESDGLGGFVRYFTITSRRVDHVSYDVAGLQDSTGGTEYHIVTDAGEYLTSEQARLLAAALAASADQLDGLEAGQ